MDGILNFVADLAITGGPVGAAILLIYVAHDKLNARCQEAAAGTASTSRKRFYDRLYAAFWGFVGLLLATGSGAWIAQTFFPATDGGMIVRGVFTRIPVEVEIEADAGRFFVHRQIHSNLVSADVEWVLSSLSGDRRPEHTTFLITGEDEVEVQCTLDFVKAGMTGGRRVEIRYVADDRALKLPDSGAVYPCTTETAQLDASRATDLAAGDSFWFAAFAADKIDRKALTSALNSDQAKVRRSARTYLRDSFAEDPDLVYAPLLDSKATYRERLGALWALSRLEPLPREEMFAPDAFSDEIWRVALEAAIGDDEAMRTSGRRFVITYPSEETIARLDALRATIGEDAARLTHYRALLSHFYYNRGVAITQANQNEWEAPPIEAGLAAIDRALTILKESEQVEGDEYAKGLYGRGWVLAVGAGLGGDEAFTEDAAAAAFETFLETAEAAPKGYRYPWQQEKAAAYVKSQSLDVFEN